MGWAQAPPGLIFASEEIFNSLRDDETKYFSRRAKERFAHEIAHQYYGHEVRPAQDPWLAEAVAEYMAGVFLDLVLKKNDMKFLYTAWHHQGGMASGAAPLYSYPWLHGCTAGDYRFALVYNKGPAVIQAIRDKVGDQMFWTVLRSFLRSLPFKEVTTDDFIELLNFVSKCDWKPFFDRYIYGWEMPPKSKAF